MKLNEMREKSKDDLLKLIVDLNRERFNLRMTRSNGGTIKTHRLAEIRKLIAQIKTVLSARENEVVS